MRSIRTAAAAALAAGAALAAPLAQAPGAGAGEEQLVEDIVAWVNDDVVLLSDVAEQEQMVLAQLMREQQVTSEQLQSRIGELRGTIILELIWNRLLVQQAEQLFSLDGIKKDLVQQFMKRNQLESFEQLDLLLREQLQMTREELGDRLLLSAAPDYVVQTQVRARLGVSEAEAREHYEANLASFTTPASVTFTELVLFASGPEERAAERERIAELAARAGAGEDFVELVREHSEAPSKAIDGKIGPIDPADLIAEIRRATTQVDVGAVSAPIETDQGWHLVRVENRQDLVTQSFEEVRETCEEAVRRKKMETEYRKFVEELWDDSTVEIRKAYAGTLPERWLAKTKVRD